MLDYENTFKHLSFTSVRDTYKTRELVNIIRSKLPDSCGNKNFSGKVMLHNKTKYTCGIYLRCQEKSHQSNHVCSFKIFLRLNMDDNIYRLYEKSENTSYVCTCPSDYVSPIKEDKAKHEDVVKEVEEVDKKNPKIEPKSKIPDPVFIKDSDKQSYTTSPTLVNDKVPQRSIRKHKESTNNDFKKLSNVLRVSSRKRESSQTGSRSPSNGSKRLDSDTVIEDESNTGSLKLSKKVLLDFEKLFDTISFSASKNASHCEVREMCNEAMKKSGVSKAFTYKLGMGRTGGSFTADSVYVRCCKKQGFSEKCQLRALFKRDKNTDIWSLSRNTSHINFLCHCENYLCTEMAIERASIKPKELDTSSPKSYSTKIKRSNDDLDSSIITLNEKNIKRQKTDKVIESDKSVGALQEAFCNFDFSFRKVNSYTKESLAYMIDRNFEKYNIKRKYSIAFSCEPKLMERLIIKLHMDESDSLDKEERIGNQCKISVFCYRDIKSMKKMKVILQNVNTNFDCSCKTCMKYKMQSPVYLKKHGSKDVKLVKNPILPLDYKPEDVKTEDCVDFSCEKCREAADIKMQVERSLDIKMNALLNAFV